MKKSKLIYYEGVGYDHATGKITINLNQDSETDFVKTKLQKFNKKLWSRSGFGAYVAYKLEKSASDVPSFDKILKDQLLDTPGGIQLVKKSILSFNQLAPINSFDVILYPTSSSKLNDVIAKNIAAKSSANTLNIPNSIIKNSLNNVKVDSDKLENSSPAVKKRIKQLLNSPSGTLQLKKVPMIMRNMFSNFLKFDTERERELFNKINGGKVLIIDDVYTRGTTLKEIARMAFEKGASEVIFFIFLQRKS